MSYDATKAEAICGQLVEGLSLRTICKQEGMPGLRTVFDWLSDEANVDFRTKYARAREMQAELQVDEMQEIADDGQNDWMERLGRDGQSIGWVINGEAVQRSKIRLEHRRWYAEKLRSKVYGAKLELAGELTVKRPAIELTDDELAAIATGSRNADA